MVYESKPIKTFVISQNTVFDLKTAAPLTPFDMINSFMGHSASDFWISMCIKQKNAIKKKEKERKKKEFYLAK